MRLEPAAPRSRVKHSTTDPLHNNFKLRLNIMYKFVILTLLNDVITFLTSLKCNYNVMHCQAIYTVFFQFQIPIIRHKSFVSPAPWGRGIAGLLTFHFLKPHCEAKFVVKFLLNAPPQGVDNNDICIHHDVLLPRCIVTRKSRPRTRIIWSETR